MSKQTLNESQKECLRALPQVGRLLEGEQYAALIEETSRHWVTQLLRDESELLRGEILAGHTYAADTLEALLLERVHIRSRERRHGLLKRVINATGGVVHTNLGRSPLAKRALERVVEVSSGYCNLEYDLPGRRRGGRMFGVQDALRQLTGAEDALVVNNNAAAVMLALSAMAERQEVILSRGELVEIGGSFRIPDVMRTAGVRLREVGCTNRTHLRDYEDAIDEETALLLKVHQSNYVIKGFTKEVSVEELVALGQARGLPVLVDLGSGCLFDVGDAFQVHEPLVQEVLRAGVDVVTFSGDKLLGGPQAGVIAGKKEWVRRAAKRPLARALRVDKLTLAALEATLQIYLEGPVAIRAEIPGLSMLLRDISALEVVGRALETELSVLPSGVTVSLVPSLAAVGGGALPSATLPSLQLAIDAPGFDIEAFDKWLRARQLPIVARLDRGRISFDLRTLLPGDEHHVCEAICQWFDLDSK